MSGQKAKILEEFLEQKNKVLHSRNLKRFLQAKKITRFKRFDL
jgi:hypothetical protein